MNAEIRTETNNQDRVEQAQNQNGGTSNTPLLDQSLPASAADVSTVSDPTNHPCCDCIPESINSVSQPIDPSSNPATELVHQTSPPTPAAKTVEAATQDLELDGQPVITAQAEPEISAAVPGAGEAELKCHRSPCWIVPPRGPCRARRGKIASLPPQLRQWVNEQLVLQTPTKYIIDWLSEQGHPGISHNNVSKWRTGGFQDYLKEAETSAERDKRWNSLVALARAQGSSVSVTSVQMALSHHHQLLANLDLTDMSNLLAEKPDYFFRLNTSLSHLIRVNEVLKKSSQSIQPKPARTPAGNGWEERGSTGGLTLESRDRVRQKLGIFPPPLDQPSTSEPKPTAEEAPR